MLDCMSSSNRLALGEWQETIDIGPVLADPHELAGRDRKLRPDGPQRPDPRRQRIAVIVDRPVQQSEETQPLPHRLIKVPWLPTTSLPLPRILCSRVGDRLPLHVGDGIGSAASERNALPRRNAASVAAVIFTESNLRDGLI
jgi:hypothetical protein